MFGTLTPRTNLPRLLEWDVPRVWDRLLGEMGEWMPQTEEFLPRVNLAETESQIEATVELPGLKPEEVQVELHEGKLTITGEKKEEQEEKGKSFHRIERRYGKFRRVLALPTAIDEGKVEAKFENGVLRVTMGKTEESKPRHIEVKSV